ncbi:MAG: glycosyltransferase family 4 protein [Planctomycetes bacterium]|nr:glycosyltransferase family 4 protein [Planctomycetota bacterium]
MTVFTRTVLAAGLPGLDVLHLDTSDHRGIGNVGRLDLVNAWNALRHLVALAGRLLAYRPDVLYLPIAQGRLGYLRDGLFLVLARLARVPAVVHLHGSALRAFHDSTDPVTRAFLSSTLSAVSHAIVLTESLRDQFEPFVPADRIRVVENGVEGPADPATLPHEGLRVGYLGLLAREKGTLALLEASLLVLEARPEVRFAFAGHWYAESDRQAAEAILARRPELAHRVEFPGPLDGEAKERFLASLDLFVFTPLGLEGQPLILLEAMARGLPLAIHPTGGIAETAPETENAVHIPRPEPPAIARAIVDLLGDPHRRRAMGSANRARYLARHTPAACAARLAEVLARAARERETRDSPYRPRSRASPDGIC